MKVRNTVMAHFEQVTGLSSIPTGEYCLSLCGRQNNDTGFQVRQYMDAGFLAEHQYIGVDRDTDPEDSIIKHNQIQHPTAIFEKGEYRTLFPQIASKYHLRFIDLDTVGVASTESVLGWAAQTLRLASPGTLVAFNVAEKHIYCGSAPIVPVGDVLNSISSRLSLPTLKAWSCREANSGTFKSQTKHAKMRTFLFYRPNEVKAYAAA